MTTPQMNGVYYSMPLAAEPWSWLQPQGEERHLSKEILQRLPPLLPILAPGPLLGWHNRLLPTLQPSNAPPPNPDLFAKVPISFPKQAQRSTDLFKAWNLLTTLDPNCAAILPLYSRTALPRSIKTAQQPITDRRVRHKRTGHILHKHTQRRRSSSRLGTAFAIPLSRHH